MKRVVRIIFERESAQTFDAVVALMERIIFTFDKNDVLSALMQIGVIPERIVRDSSEEKLFSKASDLILARSLQLLGYEVEVPKRRGDSADVLARSRFYDYFLVADAKSFRLSRTAKNQKDYKVSALRSWKENCSANYAALVAPFFQYPTSESQIFKQALETNVCLFSWENLYFGLTANLFETKRLSLEPIWKISEELSKNVPCSNAKRNFLNAENQVLCALFGCSVDEWKRVLNVSRETLARQGYAEIKSLENEIEKVRNLPREEAVMRLIKALKFEENITTIKNFIRKISNDGGRPAELEK